MSRPGDLDVSGALKELSHIGETSISPRFCSLSMQDDTGISHDPTLRGLGQFAEPEFTSVTGPSGRQLQCDRIAPRGHDRARRCRAVFAKCGTSTSLTSCSFSPPRTTAWCGHLLHKDGFEAD